MRGIFILTIGILLSVVGVLNFNEVQAIPFEFATPADFAQEVNPSFVEVDDDGNFYTLSGGLHKVSSNGNLIWTTGSTGQGTGQFSGQSNSPIAVDAMTNRIYVSDRTLERIQVFDEDGIYLFEFGKPPVGEFQVFGITVDSGKLYAAEFFKHRINVFDITVEPPIFLGTFGSQGTGLNQLSFPSDVTLDSSGRIYVTTQTNHVKIFNPFTGGTATEILSFDAGEPVFNVSDVVGSIDITSDNILYVANRDNRIDVFDAFNGVTAPLLIDTIGSVGQGLGEFSNPNDVAVFGTSPNKIIYVSEQNNSRIQAVDESGVSQLIYGTDATALGRLNVAQYFTVDTAGNIYVSEEGNNRVQIFDAQGQNPQTFGQFGSAAGDFNEPFGIAVNSNADIFVADSRNHRIQVFELVDADYSHKLTIGSFGRTFADINCNTNEPDAIEPCDGQFWVPHDVDFDSNGNIYVLDTFNGRIQKFDSAGNFLLKWGGETCGALNPALSCTTPGNFLLARSFAIHNDLIYVPDQERVQIFNTDGMLLSTLNISPILTGGAGFPLHLELDSMGRIYVPAFSFIGTQIAGNVLVYNPFTGSEPTFLTRFASLGTGNSVCPELISEVGIGPSDKIYSLGGSSVKVYGPLIPTGTPPSLMFTDTGPDGKFEVNHNGLMTITDPNTNPAIQEQICVLLTSDTDEGGISVVLSETTTPGVFTPSNLIRFTSAISNPAVNALQVTDGDTVTAIYRGQTITIPIVTAADEMVLGSPIPNQSIIACDPGIEGPDADNDRLCDFWEQGPSGLVIDGVSQIIRGLSAPLVIPCDTSCPTPLKPDIYVELDYMEGHQLDSQAILI